MGGSLPSPTTNREATRAQRQMQANAALLLCSCRAGGDGEQGERGLLSPSGLRLWETTRQRPLEEIPLRDVLLIRLGAIIQGLDCGNNLLRITCSFEPRKKKCAVRRWSRCLNRGFRLNRMVTCPIARTGSVKQMHSSNEQDLGIFKLATRQELS